MDTQLIDQEGLGYLTQCFSKIGCSFNEYKRDIGIDAIVEIREKAYRSSGKFLAVQLKSGDSFFKNELEDYYYTYISNDHIEYWLKCLMPVMFIIYSPTKNDAFWTKIDKESLVRKAKSYKIIINKSNRLSETEITDLLQLFYGRIYSDSNDFKQILQDLKEVRGVVSGGVYINGFELFMNGLIDTCLQLYFHTDIVGDLSALKTKHIGGYTFPSDVFFEKYFEVLNYHNLLAGDFDFEIEMMRSYTLPQFIKPLSINGREFVNYLQRENFEIHDRILVNSSLSHFIPYIEKS